MRLEAVSLPQLVISDLELTSALVQASRYPWFALCIPVQGEVRVMANDTSLVVSGRYGAILAPDDLVAANFKSERGRVRVVMIEKQGLEDELAMMLGRGLDRPLSFDPEIDSATSAAVMRSVNILTSELSQPDGLLTNPRIAARLGRVVMAALLDTCRHNYSDKLAAPADSQGPRAIRNAVAAIEDDPTRFHTV